jgi:hypothetical protein
LHMLENNIPNSFILSNGIFEDAICNYENQKASFELFNEKIMEAHIYLNILHAIIETSTNALKILKKDIPHFEEKIQIQ